MLLSASLFNLVALIMIVCHAIDLDEFDGSDHTFPSCSWTFHFVFHKLIEWLLDHIRCADIPTKD